jgi:hypothetical protein
MLKNHSLFKTEGGERPASIESDRDFTVVETLWTSSPQENNGALYSQLVYKVQRDPKHLISHVQRIYYTYNHHMSDPLYAAFIDLLLVLDGGGKDLGMRLLSQTKSALSGQQYKIIAHYLQANRAALTLLTGNKYTVLTNGVVKPSISPINSEDLEVSY